MNSARVFAPATVANVAVGFDVLGFAFPALGDVVTVTRKPASSSPGTVTLEAIDGQDNLPIDPTKNTATRAVMAMVDDLQLDGSFALRLEKGIPLGSGMGGSAASAVGAVVAANALLDTPLPNERLLAYALAGEAVASGGAAHGDNVTPCLYGGLCGFVAEAGPASSPEALSLPLPAGMFAVLVAPQLRLDTVAQRARLADELPLATVVAQSAHLLAFVDACHRGDREALARSMQDLLIGPQRIPLIPGMAQALAAVRQVGVVGGGRSMVRGSPR